MFIYNTCVSDARVLREARTLVESGHRVRVIALRDTRTAAQERRDGVEILRIERRPPHLRVLRAIRLARGWCRRRALQMSAARQSARSLVRASRKAPQEVLPPPTSETGGEVAQATAPRVPSGVVTRLMMRLHKPLTFIDYYVRAYRAAVREPLSAVHAHDLNTLPVAAAVARRARVPLVYDAHELYTEIGTLSDLERRTWKFVERRLMGATDHVVTVCDSIAGELVRRYGIRSPTVLLNVPDVSSSSVVDDGRLRRAAGLDDSAEPIVLYQGGFAPNRGLLTLVDAATQLRGGVLVLMGAGRMEDEIRARIARRGLEGRVIVLPPVPLDELLQHTAGATLGVIPYQAIGVNNYYSTPNKLFEYIAAGLAVAASDFPELRRYVLGCGVGATFDPEDASDIAATVNRLLADDAALAACRINAHRAAEHLRWSVESRKLVEIYGPATDGGGRRARA